MIFTGNFVISVKNTKDYLETESVTKAQDTATSLGMTLKSFMQDKKDPEIESIIKAIANRGFYKEIRLEDIDFSFTNTQLIESSKDIEGNNWEISNVFVDNKYGEIVSNDESDSLAKELAELEDDKENKISSDLYEGETVYKFIPHKSFKNNSEAVINFTASKGNKIIKSVARLKVNKVLVKVTRDVKFDYVPNWFINMIPMSMEETKSEISDGWKTTAVIYVSANPGDAYATLFEEAKGAIYYAAVAFVVSIILLVIFLRFILQPLKNIEKLAVNIAKGRFETIKQLPWTTEIKNVALAMNDMSTKIEGIISKLNANLENMTKKLSVDELTGLNLKQTFETDMKKMFMAKENGYILSIKIDNLAEFAKANSHQTVNKFIKDFSNILKSISKDTTAYRFYGSEFMMIAKGFSYDEIKVLTQDLKNKFELLAHEANKPEIAHIGATPFNPIGTTASILASANEAYEQSKQVGPNESFIKGTSDLAYDMEEWKKLVFNIIDKAKFKVTYIGQTYVLKGSDAGKLVMEEAFTQVCNDKGEAIPIGTFVSIAERYNKVVDFDKAVIKKVIAHIKEKEIKHEILVNLSLDSIGDNKFISWIYTTLEENEDIASQIVFSITSYGAAKNIEQFKRFINHIHKKGAKIILKRFESKFIPLDNIKDLNLDYIRLARDYTNNICQNSAKLGFVESMQELASLLNIKVYAENVKNDEDFEVVKKLNLYGASR